MATSRLSLAGLAVLVATGAANAQSPFPCDSVIKNPDGSWTMDRNVAIPGPGRDITLRGGSTISRGQMILGQDVFELIDRACPNAVPPVPPEQQVPLTTLASPAGDLDVNKMTCGQLAATAPGESDFVLAWYFGWKTGGGKQSAIKLEKVRAGIRDVTAYCRAHKDKLVAEAVAAAAK